MLVKSVVINGVVDLAFVSVGQYGMITDGLPLELYGTRGVGGIREFAFDVGDEYGSACGDVGRLEVKGVGLEGLSKVFSHRVWEGGGFSFVFYFGVIVVGG